MTTLFFPESELASWQAAGAAVVSESRLSVVDPITRRSLEYLIERAAHVALHIGDTSANAGDPFELVGRVKTEKELVALGASLDRDTMRVGPHAYAIVAGVQGKAVDPNADHERILSEVGRRCSPIGGEG